MLCLRPNTSFKLLCSNAVVDIFNNLGVTFLFNIVNYDHKALLTQRIKEICIQQWHKSHDANQPRM